jgi:hypothetical protein
VMGRVSPGMAGGFALISSSRRSRARAMRREAGRWRVTVIAAGVLVMVPARPRMMVSRVMARLLPDAYLRKFSSRHRDFSQDRMSAGQAPPRPS